MTKKAAISIGGIVLLGLCMSFIHRWKADKPISDELVKSPLSLPAAGQDTATQEQDEQKSVLAAPQRSPPCGFVSDDEGNNVADPEGAIVDLMDEFQDFALPHGLKNALTVKLRNALASMKRGNQRAASNQLGACLNQVEGMRGKRLTDVEADTLTRAAREIRARILALLDGSGRRAGAPSENRFLRGDSNADGKRNITDAVFTLRFLFGGEAAPPCVKSADFNDDSTLNLTDAVYLLNFFFSGGPPPGDPFEACGIDPTEDDLTCESYASCEQRPAGGY